MSALLYKIPEKLIDQVNSGAAQVVGALIKDTMNGQILGQVQPTKVMETLLGSAVRGLNASISQGLNPFGLVSVVQNEQIKSQLRDLNSAFGVMQTLQVSTLAVSGLGLGVSVVGFAVMLKRLNAIERHIGKLSDKIDQVTADRRSDYLETIFVDIATDLDTIETLQARKDAQRVAEAAQVSLSRSAARIKPHFERVAKKEDNLTIEDLEFLWSLASAMRLCHDASIKALFHIDELGVAAELSRKQADHFAQLSHPMAPDRLARLIARAAGDFEEMRTVRTSALGKAQALTASLRESAIQGASNRFLAQTLQQRGVSGRRYLEEAEQETESPLLLLPG